LAVVGVLGTTEYGTIDPIDSIVELRKKCIKEGLNYYIHVDAAWGGYLTSLFRDENDQFLPLSEIKQHLNYFPSKKIYDCFAALAEIGHNNVALAIAMGFEYLGVGLGTAAFTAFIARTTNPAFAATQIALFTALAVLPRTFANATTGFIVEQIGWTQFYFLCTALAVPGMLMLFKIAPWHEQTEQKVMEIKTGV